MLVVHRSLLESVCSHLCYHLREEVMTSGCCVIVQQDNASLYRRGTDTHSPVTASHRIRIEITMSAQNQPPHTEDKLLHIPEKVTIEIVFFYGILKVYLILILVWVSVTMFTGHLGDGNCHFY